MDLWFRRKTFGWGWYPCTWQGWLIMVLWIYITVRMFMNIDKISNSTSDTILGFFVPLIALVGLLLLISWGTGEKPSWRWG